MHEETPAKRTNKNRRLPRGTFTECLLRCWSGRDLGRDVSQHGRKIRADVCYRRDNDEYNQPRDKPILDGRYALVISQEALCELFHFYPRTFIYFVCLRAASDDGVLRATGPLVSHSWPCLLRRRSTALQPASIKQMSVSCLFDYAPPSSILDAFGFYSRTIIFKQLSAALSPTPYAFWCRTQVNGSSCVAAHRNNHELDSLH